MPTTMASPQACLKRLVLLLSVITCLFGRSNGFQVSPPAFRKRRSYPQAPDVVKAFHSSSFVPSLIQQSVGSTCLSHRSLDIGKRQHSLALNLYRLTTDGDALTTRRSRLFDHHSEFRLYAAPEGDDKSPATNKLRSLVSKVWSILTRPVRLVVVKPLKWVRKRLKKKDAVVEKYIEESIEEQASAVQRAIAEIEAKANEYQQKTAAIASEQDMLDKTDPVPPKATLVVKPGTDAKAEETETKDASVSPKEEAAAEIKPVTYTKAAEDMQDAKVTEDELDETDLIAQKQKATAEAQTDIVAKVEEKQTKDAALASEQDMLDKTDVAAETQTATVENTDGSTVKDSAVPLIDQATLDKAGLIAQEQQVTAEAQIEIVEKVESVQASDAALATEQGMLAQLDNPEATDADVMSKMKQPAQKQSTTKSVSTTGNPLGGRWAVSAPDVDLSGEWSLMISDDFKKDYDEYLKQLGQPFLVRSVALTLIGVTKEETEQREEGRTLFIRGTNARGIWERTLVTSGADTVNDQFTPLHVPIVTADDERVEAEAWWEDEGTVHRSWMRGLNKYGGGSFESKRYLEEGGKVLVCESIFHPNEKDRKDVAVTWRFLRNGETLHA